MHFSAQDIVLILGALGIFVSGPLVLLIRELRANTQATKDAADANVQSRKVETLKIIGASDAASAANVDALEAQTDAAKP